MSGDGVSTNGLDFDIEYNFKVLRDNKLISKSNYKTNWETVK